ncbi:MAG: putative transport system permease protein [Acidimicrobiaceae bacterium]
MTNTFRLMHLRQLKRQPLRAALAVLAIGAGVTLTVAVLIARSSLDRSFTSYNSALAGPATLRVVSRYDHGGIDASTVAAIDQVDGVQAAVPLVLTVTQVSDRHGHDDLVAVIGADCRAEAIFGAQGCDPALLAQATETSPPLIGSGARDAGGSDGVLRTDVGDRPLDQAVLDTDFDRFNRGLVAVYPLSEAQALFGRPNGLDAIYVVPEPGASTVELQRAVSAAAGPQNRVLAANDPGNGVSYISTQLLPFMLLVSLFGIAVGGQLVFNTMSLSLEERRRELAIESAIGGTPATVMVGVLSEAALLGVAGGILGIGMGLLAARPFVANLSTYAEQAAGIHLSVHPTVLSVTVGLAIGVLASMAAAIVPARRAARLDIAGELVDRSRRHDALPRVRARRAVVFTLLSAGSLVLAWEGSRDGALEGWQPTALYIGIVVVFLSAFRLTPAYTPFLVRGIEKLNIFQRGPARVAVSNLMSEGRRTSVVVTAVGSAVGMAFVLGGVLPGMSTGAARMTRSTAEGRVYVATLTPNNTGAIDAKTSPEVQARLAQLPGVAMVQRQYWASFDFPGLGPVGISSTDGQQQAFTLFQGVTVEEAMKRSEVMIGPGLARSLHLRPGSHFDIDGRFGKVTLVVGGIWGSPDNLGRNITVSSELRDRLIGPRPPSSLLLVPASGVSMTQLADTVRGAHLADNLKVWDNDQLSAEYTESFKGFLTPFWLLARGLLVVAFIATASTLLLAAVKRRAEHGLLAAVGMPPGDLGRMVLVEAGLFGLLGTLNGLIGGLLSLAAFSLASATLTGLDIPFTVSITALIGYGLLATALVLAGAALPAWRTSKLDPVIALRYE